MKDELLVDPLASAEEMVRIVRKVNKPMEQHVHTFRSEIDVKAIREATGLKNSRTLQRLLALATSC